MTTKGNGSFWILSFIQMMAMFRKTISPLLCLIFLSFLGLETAGQMASKDSAAAVMEMKKSAMPAIPDTQGLAESKRKLAAQFAHTQFTTLVTRNADKGFGYFIFADGRLIIDQKMIPALSGNQSFVSEQEARRTAELAIKKIKQGEMPPTISVKELRELKIHTRFPPDKPL